MLPQQHDPLSLYLLLDFLESHFPKLLEVNVSHFLDLVLLARFTGVMGRIEFLILECLALLFILLGFGLGDDVLQSFEVLHAELKYFLELAFHPLVHDQIILGLIRCDLVCIAYIVLNHLSSSLSLVLFTHLIECWRILSH
jgi:hypothetical protein